MKLLMIQMIQQIRPPFGIISPPPFHTKRPKRFPTMTRFTFFPKRKRFFNQPNKNNNIINNILSPPHFTLRRYSTVTSSSNDYPLNTILSIMKMKTLSQYVPKDSFTRSSF